MMPRKHPRPKARKALAQKRAKAKNPKRQTVLALLVSAFHRMKRNQ